MLSITLRTGLATGLAWLTVTGMTFGQQPANQNHWNQMRAPRQHLASTPDGRGMMRPAPASAGSPAAVAPPQRRSLETGRSLTAPVQSLVEVPRTSVLPTNYVLPHTRRQDGSVMAPGAPAPQAIEPQPQMSGPATGVPVVGGPGSASCSTCGVGNDYFLGGSYGGDCAACGDLGCEIGQGYFDRGGCPPGLIGECWIGRLGNLLYRGEYFFGGHGFKTAAFQVPGANALTQDSSFGLNAGFNFGIPLCRITCGLVSGQVGVRTVNSDFSGTPFTSDNREQLFITTGLYRRVDQGFQFGVVADFMRENWVVSNSVTQLRGDLSWVFYGGNAMGYRFAENVQDDVASGRFQGINVNDMITSTFDSHRFYYRNAFQGGGFVDTFLGFSDEQHVVGGVEYDVPLAERWALQSSFTYFFPEDQNQLLPNTGGNANEAWNVAVGVVFRPQGRGWYHNYDRPILPVADNGTMVLRRGF